MLLMKCFALTGGGMFHPGNSATGGFDIVFSMYLCSLYTCCAANVNFSTRVVSSFCSCAA